MNYIDFEAGNKSYKLRLNTRGIVALEKTIGCNPLNIFFNNGQETIPSITQMVAILHASLQQYHHGISMNDAFDIFDEYVADGHTSLEFIKVMFEIFRSSGLVPKSEEDAKNE